MRTARVVLAAVFLAILALAFASGAMRYHLLGNREAAAFRPDQPSLRGKFVRVEGTVQANSAIDLAGGPVRLWLLPLREYPQLWILTASQVELRPAGVQSFEGRLVTAAEVPFLRRRLGELNAIGRQSLVIELGHRPRRGLAWGFVGVVLAVAGGAQLLLSLWAKVRKGG